MVTSTADAWLPPGPAALAVGRVIHHRRRPAEHRFDNPMTQIWIDPDAPEELFDRHPLWSVRRPAPARFRPQDLLDGAAGPLGPVIRRRLADALGRPFDGPLRTLTQPRIWGWVFNPLTVHLAWDDGASPAPSAVLLEVTNTPWKERHWYPVALERSDTGLGARFDKALHVSPFLDLGWSYDLRFTRRDPVMPDTRAPTDPSIVVDFALDVVPDPSPADQPSAGAPPTDSSPLGDHEAPILSTRLTTRLHPADGPATRQAMTAALRPTRLPTHRVSFGIHHQALRLWRKRVPFVAHPGRRA